MRMNSPLRAAALLCAVSLSVQATAQDVPAPPPAGVKPVPRKTPAQAVQPVPEVKSDSLPQLPENAIRLEDEKSLKTPVQSPVPEAVPDMAVPSQQPPVVVPQPEVVVPDQQPEAVPAAPAETPVATRRPAKLKGPVYYYPVDPYTFPANVNTPPAPHYPNSPFPEDLSVNGDHGRYTYYSYRRPWYTPGHLSANVTIVW